MDEAWILYLEKSTWKANTSSQVLLSDANSAWARLTEEAAMCHGTCAQRSPPEERCWGGRELWREEVPAVRKQVCPCPVGGREE